MFNSTRNADDECVLTSNNKYRCQPKVNYRHKEKEVLDQILGPGSYDARIRPSGVNGTGKIRFEIILFSIHINIMFLLYSTYEQNNNF